MPRDLPDWGALSAQATIYEMTDLGELAARLGSIVSFDRRGDVIWLDDFECGIEKWALAPSGGDAAAALSPDESRNGEMSALLTAGKTSPYWTSMSHLNAFPALSNMGFEISFSLGSDLNYLEFYVELYDGTNRIGFYIQWYQTDGKLYYLDVNGDPQLIVSKVLLKRGATLFHTIKLVIGATVGEYLRVLIDSQSYPIENIAGWAIGTTGELYMMLGIGIKGRGGYNDTVYVDDVIITQNEPSNP